MGNVGMGGGEGNENFYVLGQENRDEEEGVKRAWLNSPRVHLARSMLYFFAPLASTGSNIFGLGADC